MNPMNSTEMVILFVFALIAFSAVLVPLTYAAVLDGRYNARQQRLAARADSREVRTVAEHGRVSTIAFGTAS
jgi:hypothetical protein